MTDDQKETRTRVGRISGEEYGGRKAKLLLQLAPRACFDEPPITQD